MMKQRTYESGDLGRVRRATECLRTARELFKQGRAPDAANAVRHALSSVKGVEYHVGHAQMRAQVHPGPQSMVKGEYEPSVTVAAELGQAPLSAAELRQGGYALVELAHELLVKARTQRAHKRTRAILEAPHEVRTHPAIAELQRALKESGLL